MLYRQWYSFLADPLPAGESAGSAAARRPTGELHGPSPPACRQRGPQPRRSGALLDAPRVPGPGQLGPDPRPRGGDAPGRARGRGLLPAARFSRRHPAVVRFSPRRAGGHLRGPAGGQRPGAGPERRSGGGNRSGLRRAPPRAGGHRLRPPAHQAPVGARPGHGTARAGARGGRAQRRALPYRLGPPRVFGAYPAAEDPPAARRVPHPLPDPAAPPASLAGAGGRARFCRPARHPAGRCPCRPGGLAQARRDRGPGYPGSVPGRAARGLRRAQRPEHRSLFGSLALSPFRHDQRPAGAAAPARGRLSRRSSGCLCRGVGGAPRIGRQLRVAHRGLRPGGRFPLLGPADPGPARPRPAAAPVRRGGARGGRHQ